MRGQIFGLHILHDAKSHPKMHALLCAFEKKTGNPMLINTSFNVRNEPMVCTAEDAYRCFMRTGMDILLINNYIFYKEAQPVWNESGAWQSEFQSD